MIRRRLFCPVTSHEVRWDPAWVDRAVSEHFASTHAIVGDVVLYSRPQGFVRSADARGSIAHYEEVAARLGSGYILIEDLARLEGHSWGGRKEVIEHLLVRVPAERLLGIVFCNATLPSQLAIRLGARFDRHDRPLVLCRSYDDAIETALGMASDAGLEPSATVLGAPFRYRDRCRTLEPVELAESDGWTVEIDGYLNVARIVDNRIMISVSTGKLTADAIPLLAEARAETAASLPPGDRLRSIVVDVSEMDRGGTRNRQLYIRSLLEWHGHSPLDAFVMVGAGAGARVAVKMAGALTPFRTRVAGSLDEAFRLLRRQASPGDDATVRSEIESGSAAAHTQRLIRFLGEVEWENPDDAAEPPTLAPDEPFRPVYESLWLIKSEISSLLRERRDAESRLQASERRYRRLYEGVSDVLLFHDLDGRVLESNVAFKEEFGGQIPSGVVLNMRNAIAERYRDEFESYLERVLEHGRDTGLLTVALADGRELVFEYDNVLVHDEEGQPVGVNCSGRDVTHRTRAERLNAKLQEELLQARKMEAIGTLAGGVAHDFNNLLAAIQTNAELAGRNLESPTRVGGNLDEIVAAVRRAKEVVSRILVYSRATEATIETVDPAEVAAETVRMLERMIPKMIDLRVDIDLRGEVVLGNRSELQQMILNLASNAVHAMPSGGSLTISLGTVDLESPVTTTEPGDQRQRWIRLEVADTGVGMDDDTRRRVFEPFFTTKQVGEGTGLGLYVLYGTVTGWGGRVTCESAPGRGAVFHVDLPVAGTGSEAAESEPDGDLDTAAGHGRLLVVDDDPAVRGAAEQLLDALGYEVVTADCGERAVELFGADPAAIDGVVLDLGMPGMGGQRCLVELLRIDPTAKVVVASGYASDETRREVLSAGAAAFLSKPYTVAGLSATLRDAVGDTRAHHMGTS